MTIPKNLKICSRCVMDETDPKISFNENGVCNHCLSYEELEKNWNLKNLLQNCELEKTFNKIIADGKGKDFDCVMGLSGGVDSSYVALLAKQAGLRPLCVHLDNGWNSELAVANIHSIVDKLGFTLYTHVIDWEEFRDLQRSFFKANVVDIELLTDHAIFGVILQLAKKYKVKYILSGANNSTEAVMPKAWVHRKQDLKNILDIHAQFGAREIKSFPKVSTLVHVWSMYVQGYKVIKPLNMIDYKKSEVKARLQAELGWRDYGGKHYESLFTKFYQAHILPNKFKIDKRKAHLSSLICSGQMTRAEALCELEQPLYPEDQLSLDRDYVCKKLDFSRQEFDQYMAAPPRSHYEFKSDQWVYDLLFKLKKFFSVEK
jgi:N-acetyl sugar amidotransferase